MRIQHGGLTGTVLAVLTCAIFLTTCLAHDNSFFRSWTESAASNNATQDARELTPGSPVERELSGGETHSYRVALIEGQYLRALVKGQDINLLVTLYEPGGEKIFERGRNHRLRHEVIMALARQSGDHRLTVSAGGQQGHRGRYTIKIEELRNALPEDSQRVAAERSLAEGELLSSQAKAESNLKALEKFEESISNWRAIGDRLGEAQAHNNMGLIHRAMGDSRKALDRYKQALPLFQAGADHIGEVETINNMAVAHYALGELKTSIELSQKALSMSRKTGNTESEVSALNNLGSAYLASGAALLALDYYNQALPLRRALRDLAGEARTLNNIGTVYSALGEPQKTLESYLQALPLRRQEKDIRGEVTTLSNIGLIYHGMGEPQKALEYNERALQLGKHTGDVRQRANALRNIALAHSGLGDDLKALDYYQQALDIFREKDDKRGEAQILSLMGSIYNQLGDNQKALDYYSQAMTICKTAGYSREEAKAHEGMGQVYREWAAGRDLDKSLDHYRQSLTIQKALKLPTEEIYSLLGIARVERDHGNTAEARANIEAAIEIIESLRARIQVQDLRASYLSINQDLFEFYIDLLMEARRNLPPERAEEYEAAAFEANERRLARSLIDALTEARADIRQGVDPELLAEERSLRQRINAKETYRIQLLGVKRAKDQAAREENELNDLGAQYQNVQARIRGASPRYAELTQARVSQLREIQRQSLDDETLLLEFALGKERSYLWAVTRNSIASFELPSRETIETATKRVYELLNVSHKRQRKRESELALVELSRMLLGPVANRLDKKRLLIVAHGALQYAPFAALPAPEMGRRGDGETGRRSDKGTGRMNKSRPVSPSPRPPVAFAPLIANHEIINLPSASTLTVLRRDLAGRPPASGTVAVLADPVLEADDARVKQSVAGAKTKTPTAPVAVSAETNDPVRSAGEAGVLRLARLPFTRQEAEAILTLARDGKSLKALDFNASLDTATSPELSEYRIVHFATHGFINSRRPQLSGIVLSLVNEQGRPQDGFLRAHDIYNLRLGADLVVLSACQTALGKQVNGEGLVGLVRGFMYAGAPRVAASLWNVKDDATAELMKRFYEKMLKEGMTPAAALRAAQVSMWKDKRWEAPYFWAGFILQGEWR
ncbi:MAG TPA: CHAT domain-containing tetratricopeptide repeat protein [Blastocatellia bacterium]|nr:CHAT domain-containing tetratricopeptide repeat protein [Blastocatellia bacterium]